MAKLIGAQRMVLQAIFDLPKNAASYVTEDQIAQSTQIALTDVRDWLDTLDGEGYVNVARTTGGLTASITAQGKLIIRQFQPLDPPSSGSTSTTNPTPATATPSGTPPVRTILLLAANPKGTPPLRLDEEVKKIDQGLERAKKRDQFKLVQKWAVTDDDLRRAMLDNDPEIVHFSGHGSGEDGLAFEDDAGQTQLISGDALGRLFELWSDTVKCVVLNACYSEAQADAIAKHIDYVVGMKKAIGDEAAIKFAVGFYDALGAGRDVEKAFKFGCIAIDLKGIPEYLTPVLKKKS
jgi:CHAT domain